MGTLRELPLHLDEAEGDDAAEVGVALALPEGLEAALHVLAADWEPVEEAVEAGRAGLDAMRVATMEANGMAVAPPAPDGADPEDEAEDEDWGAEEPAGPQQVAERVEALMPAAMRPSRMGVRGGVARGAPARGVSEVLGARRKRWGHEAQTGGGGARGPRAEAGAGERANGVRVAAGRADQVSGGAAPVRETRAERFQDEGEAGVALTVQAVAPGASAAPGGPMTARGGADGEAWPGEPESVAPMRLRADVARVLARRGAVAAAEVPVAAAPGRMQDGGEMRGGEGVGRDESAAPRAERREEGGQMGAVHLDGHLVGYWLSERMGRDAARPGLGTTFFDPRQAPAWTPAGVI